MSVVKAKVRRVPIKISMRIILIGDGVWLMWEAGAWLAAFPGGPGDTGRTGAETQGWPWVGFADSAEPMIAASIR